MSMSTGEVILKARHLEKNYGTVRALQDVNLNFEDYKICGLYGRNDAGIKLLSPVGTIQVVFGRGDRAFIGPRKQQNQIYFVLGTKF